MPIFIKKSPSLRTALVLLGTVGVAGAGLIPASPALATAVEPSSQSSMVFSDQREVLADVLGLGYDQVVRIVGSELEIAQPAARGGAVLRSFDVGHAAAQLAVSGQTINIASNYEPGGQDRAGSAIRQYRASGVLTNQRAFPIGVTITSMKAYVEAGRSYLAVDFGEHGSRILDADRPGLPDVPRRQPGA